MSTWIRGQPAGFDLAVTEAAAMLTAARSPVIAGLAADVDAIRAAFSLGSCIGASIDPAGAANLYPDLAAFARAGAMTTTPSEMLRRADVVIAIGSRASTAPIVESARATEPTAGGSAGPRRVLTLEAGNAEEPLAQCVAILRASATGRLRSEHPSAGIADILGSARFGVAVYDPEELGELGIEMLQGLVAELNEESRFFSLALPDPWQSRCTLQVSTWLTACGPRVGLGRDAPEHDPWRFDAARQAEAGEIDAVLWISALDAPQPPWLGRLPSISLIADASEGDGQIVFAVGAPGRTCGGVVWDERLATLRYVEARGSTSHPGAADVIRTIERAIRASRGAPC